ncbi:MAG: DUF3352 domain-containing protein [Candidatus Electrothrix sp. AR4]|nr:DUF3352 domain-containing protein [Candidatus Electrothrix sp. AR4]
MKKIIIFVFICVGIAGAALYLTHRPATPEIESDYYADYLPEDTLLTLNLLDLSGVSETFPQSALGDFLVKPTMHEIMRELNATNMDIKIYDDLYDGLADVMTNPAFQQVFGDDAVIALRTPNPDRLRQNPEQEIQDSMLAFGTSATVGPIERIARIIMSKNFTNEHVSGLDMTRIRLNENEILYGYSENGILILAYNPDSIVTAVKQKKTGNTLRNSTRFTATEKFWGKNADGHVYAQSYLNIVQLRTLLATSKQEKIKNAAAYLNGVTNTGGLIVAHQGELHITTQTAYDPSSFHEAVKKQYQSLPDENFSLSMLTEKTLLHYWFSNLNNDCIKTLLSIVNSEQGYTTADETIQQELGFSLEQVMTAAGPQAGIAIQAIINAGMFPLPKTVLFLQIQDRKTAQQILDKLRKKITEQGFAEEHHEEIHGHTIYYWTVMPIEATHLATVLTDNMLYIANGESSLKKLLADQQEPTELPQAMSDALGDSLAQRVTGTNYSTFFMRPAQIAAQSGEAADWLSEMLLASKNVSAKKLLKELLKLMGSIDIITISGNIEKKHATSTVIFKKMKTGSAEKK